MNCVEILYNATAWSVPAITTTVSGQHVLYLIPIFLSPDWSHPVLRRRFIFLFKQIMLTYIKDEASEKIQIWDCLLLPFIHLMKALLSTVCVSASTYYMDCLQASPAGYSWCAKLPKSNVGTTVVKMRTNEWILNDQIETGALFLIHVTPETPLS